MPMDGQKKRKKRKTFSRNGRDLGKAVIELFYRKNC